jgi:hypothetical protein
MALNLKKPIDIADWMDNKNYPLRACYQGSIKGYSKAQFLQELKELATCIRCCSNSGKWNEINISRCIKGLKGVPAIFEVQEVLIALTKAIQQSSAKLNLLYSKCLTSLSYAANPTAWSQSVASLLKLSKTNKINLFSKPDCAELLLPGNMVDPSLEQVTELFIDTLTANHVKNNLLNLHGLDHLSAQKLLTDGELKDIDIIVFGRGSHSKSRHANTMKTIVEYYINDNNLQAKWQNGKMAKWERADKAPCALYGTKKSCQLPGRKFQVQKANYLLK